MSEFDTEDVEVEFHNAPDNKKLKNFRHSSGPVYIYDPEKDHNLAYIKNAISLDNQYLEMISTIRKFKDKLRPKTITNDSTYLYPIKNKLNLISLWSSEENSPVLVDNKIYLPHSLIQETIEKVHRTHSTPFI